MITAKQDGATKIRTRRTLAGNGEIATKRTHTRMEMPASREAHPARQSIADRTPVSAIMTTDVICVQSDVSIEAVTRLLLERGISGVPVVDADGVPIGVVSKTDLLREEYENDGLTDVGPVRVSGRRGVSYGLGSGFHRSRVVRATVADVMTGLTFGLCEGATISQAAALMAYEGVHRVPVTNEEGEVVGIVSVLDVMRWLARSDGYLARQPEQ